MVGACGSNSSVVQILRERKGDGDGDDDDDVCCQDTKLLYSVDTAVFCVDIQGTLCENSFASFLITKIE